MPLLHLCTYLLIIVVVHSFISDWDYWLLFTIGNLPFYYSERNLLPQLHLNFFKSFKQNSFTFKFQESRKDNINILYCFGSLFASYHQQLNGWLQMPGLGALIRQSTDHGGTIITPSDILHSNYIHIHIIYAFPNKHQMRSLVTFSSILSAIYISPLPHSLCSFASAFPVKKCISHFS